MSAEVGEYPAKFNREVTPLYGVVPQGAGTSLVESTHSYLLALAYHHGLSANVFVREMLHKASVRMSRDPVSTWGWDKRAGLGLLTTGDMAEKLAAELAVLTGREEVVLTNFAPLRAHICGQSLVSPVERVCQACLAADAEEGRLPYGRLLWRMQAVTCCPVHQLPLVTARCGDSERRDRGSAFMRRRIGGSCGRCGSIAFRCLSPVTEEVTANALWKASQCAKVIAQLTAIQRSSPLVVKDAIRHYCRQTNGPVALAKRAGVEKSVISRWLNEASARISLPMVLAIAASEGFSVAGLMQGDLARSPLPYGVAPDRTPRRLLRHDHCRIDRHLRRAVEAGETISDVAKAVSASTSTLARHAEIYAKLRDDHKARVQQSRLQVQTQALQEAEEVALEFLRRGVRPTLRRATAYSGSRWLPSQLRAVLLIELRRAIGDPGVRAPLKSAHLGAAIRAQVFEAARRVSAAVAAERSLSN